MQLKTSPKGIALLNVSEGSKLFAYPDSCIPPVWTIGVGCIKLNGVPVKKGDTITQEQNDSMLMANLATREVRLNYLVPNIPQNKFDAIINLAYQEGAWETSTLIKKARVNPNDPTIADEFKKWIMVSGKPSDGVIIRRGREILMYFEDMKEQDLIDNWAALKKALDDTHQTLAWC